VRNKEHEKSYERQLFFQALYCSPLYRGGQVLGPSYNFSLGRALIGPGGKEKRTGPDEFCESLHSIARSLSLAPVP
jgi:hypothetical protein